MIYMPISEIAEALTSAQISQVYKQLAIQLAHSLAVYLHTSVGQIYFGIIIRKHLGGKRALSITIQSGTTRPLTMIWFLILAVVCPKPGIADRLATCHDDPRCTTFDGHHISYHGTCDTVLLDECSGPRWLGTTLQIIGRQQSCDPSQRDDPFAPRPTCVQEIAAIINGVQYRLVLDNNYIPQFQTDDQRMQLFAFGGTKIWLRKLNSAPGVYIAAARREGGMCLLLLTKRNQYEYMKICLTDLQFLVYVSTSLEKRLKNRICGLFGNMNNIEADDKLSPQHVITGRCRGNTKSPRKKRTAAFEFCKTKAAEARARKECAIINQKRGPFKNCYKKNSQRQQMFRNCVNDVCVDTKYKCASIEGYARSCSIFGVCNGDWRAKTGCKLQCPNGMKYTTRFYQEKNPTCLHQFISKCVAASSSPTHWGRRGRGKSNVEKCAKRKINRIVKKGRQVCLDGCACPGSKIWDPSVAKCVNISDCKDPFKKLSELSDTKDSDLSDRIKNLFNAGLRP